MDPQQQVLKAAAAWRSSKEDEFDVELTEVGPNKVKVIEVVCEITGLGLKEAKEVVETVLQSSLKKALPKQKLKTSRLNLKLKALKFTLK